MHVAHWLSAALFLAAAFMGHGTGAVSAHEAKGADSHDHDHAKPSHIFASLTEGLMAIDLTLRKAEAAVAENRLDAFHDLGLELHAVADGLAPYDDDRPQAKRARFAGAVNQLRTLGDRMHDVHATSPVVDAQRLLAQARSIEKILQANAR
jgi:hypothetical protein